MSVRKRKFTPSQEYCFLGRVRVAPKGSFFGPHKTLPRFAIVTIPHDSPSGIPLRKGYKMDFGSKERRDKWLRSQGFRGRL